MENSEVFGGRVHVGVVGAFVKVVSGFAVGKRIKDKADHVTGNAANIIVLDTFQSLNDTFQKVFDSGVAGRRVGSTFGLCLGEEGGIEFRRHSVDVVVGTSGHDVSDAESVKVELCGFFDDLLVGVKVYGSRRNGDRVALAGSSCRTVRLGSAVLEALKLDGTAGRIASVRLGLQALGKGVLLNVADHKAGKFGKVYLRRTGLDQADCFCSCHCKSFLSDFWFVCFYKQTGPSAFAAGAPGAPGSAGFAPLISGAPGFAGSVNR